MNNTKRIILALCAAFSLVTSAITPTKALEAPVLQAVAKRVTKKPSVKLTASGNKHTLTWKAVKYAQKYEVYRSTSKSSGYELVATVTARKYVGTVDDTSKTYYYKVRAVGTANYTDSAIKTIAPKKVAKAPAVKVKSTYNTVTLSWRTVKNAYKYEIYRSTVKAGTYTKVGETTAKKFVDKTVETNTTYFYKVRAVAAGNHKDSAVKTVTPKLAAPKAKYKNNKKLTTVKVTWKKVAGAVTYDVYASTAKKKGFVLVAEDVSALSFTYQKPVQKKNYYFKVVAKPAKKVTPVTPSPVNPSPVTPVNPTPSNPTPVNPVNPQPSNPTPAEPQPSNPVNPQPSNPTPSNPTPVTPDPTPVTPVTPDPVTPVDPTPVTPVNPEPVTPSPSTPVTPTPSDPTPSEPSPQEHVPNLVQLTVKEAQDTSVKKYLVFEFTKNGNYAEKKEGITYNEAANYQRSKGYGGFDVYQDTNMEWVVVKPAVKEQGHYETVHHEATYIQVEQEEVVEHLFVYNGRDYATGKMVTYYSVRESEAIAELSKPENLKYICKPGTNEVIDNWQIEADSLYSSYLREKYNSPHTGWLLDYYTEMQLVDIEESPAYDEKVWVVDVPAQPEIAEWRSVIK